jgi:flagellar basal-body rod protein FlgB
MKVFEGEAPMFEKLELTRMAQSLAAYSGSRMGVIARNVAHADTPGFKAMDVSDFASVYEGRDGLHPRTTRPGHFVEHTGRDAPRLVHDGAGMAPNGNDVSLDLQMMKAVESRQSHEMALAVYRSTSGIIRASLGRNG